MPFFKRSHQSQPQQPQLQSFILEPILTPSGLIDGTDEAEMLNDGICLPKKAPKLVNWEPENQYL